MTDTLDQLNTQFEKIHNDAMQIMDNKGTEIPVLKTLIDELYTVFFAHVQLNGSQELSKSMFELLEILYSYEYVLRRASHKNPPILPHDIAFKITDNILLYQLERLRGERTRQLSREEIEKLRQIELHSASKEHTNENINRSYPPFRITHPDILTQLNPGKL
ncbi:MAG: hypothetical protein OHK0046_11110 [Anaerolineae bacterium]